MSGRDEKKIKGEIGCVEVGTGGYTEIKTVEGRKSNNVKWYTVCDGKYPKSGTMLPWKHDDDDAGHEV